jgi:hypothetical protein
MATHLLEIPSLSSLGLQQLLSITHEASKGEAGTGQAKSGAERSSERKFLQVENTLWILYNLLYLKEFHFSIPR